MLILEVADGKPIEVTVKLEDLTPSTSYWFEFAGENDAGEGPARTVSKNTQAFGEYRVNWAFNGIVALGMIKTKFSRCSISPNNKSFFQD